MTAAPDTLLVTGPVNQQVSAADILVTPTGGAQNNLADLVNGGTVGQTFRLSATNAVSTAGSTQATGTPLTTMLANATTVTAGQGVNLLASAPGLFEVVTNNGTADAIAYAVQGGTETINGFAGSIGVIVAQGGMAVATAGAAGAINVFANNPRKTGYIANTASAAATLTAASMASAECLNVILMSGSLSGGAVLTMPTVAALMAARPGVHGNDTFTVRIANTSAGAFSWTLTAGTAESVAGTATIAQNAWRDFEMQFINGTSVVAQNLGSGTF